MVIEHARQGDDPGSSPPTLSFVTLSFSVFTLFENNSKCLGDALSLTACQRHVLICSFHTVNRHLGFWSAA